MNFRSYPPMAVILLAVWIPLAAGCGRSSSAVTVSEKSGGENPARRIPWTASAVRGSPDPPPPFRTRRAYPQLAFKRPTAIVPAPGTDRLFVTEQGGRVYSFRDDPECREADLFLDVAELVARLTERTAKQPNEKLSVSGLFGIAFHPDFAENRQVFVSYAVGYEADGAKPRFENGARVVRLTASRDNPPRCDPDSETVLLTWQPGGHQGGCLAFGPDGFLYASAGDSGDPVPSDGYRTGQDVSDLLAAVLRIDVDRTADGLPYAIPPDNPLLSYPGARGEIFAYGMRNPWKFSFDRQTGALWVGDVGWEMWEWIYKVKPGDNFGWSVTDGSHPLHVDWPRGPTPIVPPTVELSHSDAASITGGYVYRGSRIPELRGQYVFGDWETRRIWAVDAERPESAAVRDLVDPTLRIVAFGEKNDGELLVLDYDDGTIHELARNDAEADTAPFPTTLSRTGLFADMATLAPMPGVLPFEIQSETWADHASAVRHVGVPGAEAIGLYATAAPLPGSLFERQLHFPAGTVLAKTFSMEMEHGRPETARRLETQILHFDGLTWRGYTYAWNEAQTDAELVPAAGRTIELDVVDAAAPGGVRHQNWTLPSRAACLRCHNPWAENALAFNVPQLNRDVADGRGAAVNQLRRFRAVGLLEDKRIAADPADGSFGKDRWPGPEDTLPRLADPWNPAERLDARGRSYFHANCAHCHRFGGGGSAYVLLNGELPLADMQAVGVQPRQGGFGIENAEIIAPGDPYRSSLFYRMSTAGPGRMPHIGSEIVDARGLALIHDWIAAIPARIADEQAVDRLVALLDETVEERERADLPRQRWRSASGLARKALRDEPAAEDFARADEQLAEAAAKRRAERAEQRRMIIAKLISSTGRSVLLSRALLNGRLPPAIATEVLEVARAHPDAVIAALFEPHVPEADRVRRLGTAIDPAALLARSGDADRGRALFRESGATQCRNCHVAEGTGREVGPPLGGIATRLGRAEVLESILWPSKKIDPKYQTWIAQLADGRVASGLLVERTADRVVLRDAEGREHSFAVSDIDDLQPQATSLMPEHQLRDLTAEQAADLLAYLETLR